MTPVKLQQDSGDPFVSAVDVTSGPEVDFLDPPCCRGPATNPGPSDVLQAGEGFAVRSFPNFGR